MIKRIDIEDVTPGMFIVDIAGTWSRLLAVDHKHYVADDAFIQLLRKSGFKQVFVDTDRFSEQVAESVVEMAPVIQEADLGQQLKQSLVVQAEARNVVNRMITDVQKGKKLVLNEAEDVVAKVADTVLQNKFVLAGLSGMKQKNRYLFEHPVSCSVLMISFAHTYGFDTDTQCELGLGAMLFDIGMLNVPSQILNIPGQLSKLQVAELRKHVDYGCTILENNPDMFESSLLMTREHHERLNGKGYPRGEPGNALSLYGKMAAIVDVYDAATSDKGYRKGLLPTVALSEIFLKSKSQFDEELVNIFIKSVGIYPYGSVVRLVNGLVGIVIRLDPEMLLYPELRIIANPKKSSTITPYNLNLQDYQHDPEYKIKQAIPKSTVHLENQDILNQISAL